MVEAPDILYNETSNDTIVAEGASVTLRCEARGYPEPIVTWRREDGAPIVLRNNPTPIRIKMQIHTHSSIIMWLLKILLLFCGISNNLAFNVAKTEPTIFEPTNDHTTIKGAFFGHSVVITNDQVLVGAPGQDEGNVFKCELNFNDHGRKKCQPLPSKY